ncbi:MAG: GerMN domain-containing protein [Patescibacteria group bacterium]|jgi:hypothetical protein
MINKKVIIGLVIFGASIIALVLIRGLSGEDNWICANGQWIKHGEPSASRPTVVCQGQEEQSVISQKKLVKPEIEVDTPFINEEIKSPLTISGQARGSWYFEASFPIKIIADSGEILAVMPAQAQSNWMTENFVPFSSVIFFDPKDNKTGKIILKNDNPSGDLANDKSYELPVQFAPMEKIFVKVFFNNEDLNPGALDCSKVFSVEREVNKIPAIGRAALEELLLGPDTDDKNKKYFTSINDGVKINSLTIENGIARVDFNEKIEEAVGGSCRVSAIRAQITETLKQFSTVSEVIISVDGNIEEVLQP